MTLANPQILFIWLPHVWATSVRDGSDYPTIKRDELCPTFINRKHTEQGTN